MEYRRTYKPAADLKVALAGLGGVGGCCARALHVCGVDELIASDFDTYQAKNYSYQFFASPLTVSDSKTDAARNRLPQWFNSPTRIKTLQADLKDSREAERLVDGSDLVISALDNFAAQSSLAAACEKARTPYALITSMGFCIQYTIYLPDPPHAYSSAWKGFSNWKDFSNRKGFSKQPDKTGRTLDPKAYERMMKLQSLLFAAQMAGYTEDALRGMLESFRKNGETQYYDLAGINYTAAVLGVVNALRYVTGGEGAVIFPDVVSVDIKNKRRFDGRIILKRMGALNRAWYQGNEAVLECIRKWRQTEDKKRFIMSRETAGIDFRFAAGAAMFGRQGMKAFSKAGAAILAEGEMIEDLLQCAVQSGIEKLLIAAENTEQEMQLHNRLDEFVPGGTNIRFVRMDENGIEKLIENQLTGIAFNVSLRRATVFAHACMAASSPLITSMTRGWFLFLVYMPAGQVKPSILMESYGLLNRLALDQPPDWAEKLTEMSAGIQTWHAAQRLLCAPPCAPRFCLMDLWKMRWCHNRESISRALNGNGVPADIPWETLQTRMP